VSSASTTTRGSDPILRYRRRSIGAQELAELKELIEAEGAGGFKHLLRVVAEAWDWRLRDGRLNVAACQDLLRKLERSGLVALPAAKRTRGGRSNGRRGFPLLPREWWPTVWYPLEPDDVQLNDLHVRPVKAEEVGGWNLIMERYHYLGNHRIVGERLKYVAEASGELVGLLSWGPAALHVPARDGLIGWGGEEKLDRLHLVVNNTRFLIPRWVRKPHLASKVLGMCLRRLSADWLEAWGHPVVLAETFVDPRRFRGTCYRAANWRHIGRTAGRRRQINDYRHDSTPKDIYIYELRKGAIRGLHAPEQKG
jgi:hypothetical protein